MSGERRPDDRDGETAASSDERDVGWGGRDWDTGDGDTSDDGEDRDLERLIAERPPHHEERER